MENYSIQSLYKAKIKRKLLLLQRPVISVYFFEKQLKMAIMIKVGDTICSFLADTGSHKKVSWVSLHISFEWLWIWGR